jgi:cell division protein FtsW
MSAAVAVSAPGAARRGTRARGVQRERHQPSYGLLLATIALVAFGVVMVYSASSVRSYFSNDDPAAQGLQQLIWAVLGLAAMYAVSRLDFRHLRYLAIPAYVVTLVMLVVVLIPSIGTEVAGSRRWISVPGIGGFQPAEIAKLAIVLYLAHWLDRRGKVAGSFWNGLVPFCLLVAPGFVLIALEPDLGTAGVYAAAALAVFFMAGANMLYLGAIGSSVLGIATIMVMNTPYQLTRVQTFLNPERDPLGAGYNTMQALMALALGGITGLGLGASKQKFLYLPAPSTDFIFAIIGEEWGLFGTLAVVALFVTIAYQGYRIAIHAPDTFSGLLAAGITTWLLTQACVNMMVVTALLPVTGIPLPFISYGGSALTINLVAIGVLLSISRETSQTGSLFDAIGGFRRRDRRAHLPRAGRRARAGTRSSRRR